MTELQKKDEDQTPPILTGRDFATSSKYVALASNQGYDEEIYGATGATASSQYQRVEVDEDESEDIFSIRPGSSSVRSWAVAQGAVMCLLSLLTFVHLSLLSLSIHGFTESLM